MFINQQHTLYLMWVWPCSVANMWKITGQLDATEWFGHHYAHHQELKSYTDGCCQRPTTCKPKRHIPQAATTCITLELLMMGIMVPETCWADSKFCNKNHSVASIWPFIFHVYTVLFHLLLTIWHVSVYLIDRLISDWFRDLTVRMHPGLN